MLSGIRRGLLWSLPQNTLLGVGAEEDSLLRTALGLATMLVITLLGLFGQSLTSVDTEELRSAVDAAALSSVTFSAAIGVIDRHQDRHVFCYSSSHAGADDVTEHSLFDIGSVTKTFTSALLVRAVRLGLVDLEAPAQRYLPADEVTLPSLGDSEIRMIDLATHTSGLPKRPQDSDYPLPPGFNPYNWYAAYTTKHIYEYLTDYCSLLSEPGTAWTYSNTGSGLLGHILGLVDGTSYWDLLDREILTPLGMSSTHMFLPDDRAADLAEGHNEAGSHAPPYTANDILQGAGFLKSSLADMFLYVEASLGLTETPLTDLFETTHRPRFQINDELGSMGMDWLIRRLPDNQRITYHAGRTGGYSAYVGFNSRLQTGVIVLCNFSAPGVATEIGEQILQIIPQY